MSRPAEDKPNGRGSESILDRPRAEELRGKDADEVRDEFGVSRDTAAKWLRDVGEYDPDRARAGTTSELSARLCKMDPDEIPREQEDVDA